MNEKMKEDTKEKILNTVVEIIGKEGVHVITVRKVADLSQVNIAAINYYFGSKDDLIEEAIQYFLERKMLEIVSILDMPEYKVDQKLFLFLKNYMEVISHYPGFPKSILASVLKGDLSFFKKINNFINKVIMKIASLIAENLDIQDMEIALIKTIQIIIPVVFPISLHNAFSNLFPLDLHDEAIKEKYIKVILESILKLEIKDLDNLNE